MTSSLIRITHASKKTKTGLLLLVLLGLSVVLSSCAATKYGTHFTTPTLYATESQDSTVPAFEVVDLDWKDETRDRAVPVRLYLPKAQAGARVPLIIFSHGIGGSRMGYSYLGSYWASHGYASLHLQHIGSDRNLWRGNVFELVPRLQNAAQDNEALERVRDLRFALDHLLTASEYRQQIDLARLIAAGHSYGANTVLLAAGAKVKRNGNVLDYRDERIRAAIIISSPPFYGETDLPAILGNIKIPTLHISCTDDSISIPGFESPATDRVKVFEATGSTVKILAVFEGGSHSVFTDRPITGGVTLNPQIKTATQKLSLAFTRQILEGTENATAEWQKENAPLLANYITVSDQPK